jgi:sugar/nucleoside kinase (ribokinase family)
MALLGVLGTLVLDTIRPHTPRGAPVVEDWGGIAYALATAEAVLPEGWQVRPLLKVGEEAQAEARQFLDRLTVADFGSGVQLVPGAHPRVELRYTGPERRTEVLRGGLPPWSPVDVRRAARGCDAIYVNFITGDELELEAARSLRELTNGVLYADLHCLLRGRAEDGRRFLRRPPRWVEWLRCFDVLQLNEEELQVLMREDVSPREGASQLLHELDRTVIVTCGERGAVGCTRAWEGVVRTSPVEGAEPTGCGDVLGLVCCTALMLGHTLEEALSWGCRVASRNAAHQGTRGLAQALAQVRAGPGL